MSEQEKSAKDIFKKRALDAWKGSFQDPWGRGNISVNIVEESLRKSFEYGFDEGYKYAQSLFIQAFNKTAWERAEDILKNQSGEKKKEKGEK